MSYRRDYMTYRSLLKCTLKKQILKKKRQTYLNRKFYEDQIGSEIK